jgi:signal transduction histidine kinase
VLDNGPGLPADRLERLFERGAFAGGHRAHGGLGLGLYLCRLIVERSFGGRIWLERSGPEGTLIRFTVPAGA